MWAVHAINWIDFLRTACKRLERSSFEHNQYYLSIVGDSSFWDSYILPIHGNNSIYSSSLLLLLSAEYSMKLLPRFLMLFVLLFCCWSECVGAVQLLHGWAEIIRINAFHLYYRHSGNGISWFYQHMSSNDTTNCLHFSTHTKKTDT